MRHFLLSCTILAFAAPALAAPAMPVGAVLAQWQSLRDPDAPGIAFSDGARFLTEYPDWPEQKTIRLRTEAAALLEHPDRGVMERFCKDSTPISGRGMIACAEAQAGDAQAQKQWIRQGWVQGDFSESEERLILKTHGQDVLTKGDNVARMERLLYEQKTAAAKRLMPYIPRSRHALFEAWLGLIGNEKKTKNRWQSLAKEQQQSPGILFARIQNALAAKQMETVVNLVHAAPANAPYPDLWWPARNIAIREAINEGKYATALAILADHGNLKSEALSEALWLKGWIMLEYKQNAALAYKDFHTLYTEVSTPVSRARAAYWAGRAAGKNGNAEIAREWYEKAAQHRTVFYGQLAYMALRPNETLALPDAPNIPAEVKQAFENDPLVAATRVLASEQNLTLRDKFLAHLAASTDNPVRQWLIAALAQELGGTSSGVKVAKMALRKQVVMIEPGWPRMSLPSAIGVEPALALAITRQESEFDPLARSSANARGMMQLLPSTARHVADRHDIAYSENSLDNPQQNILLGTTYLGQIIEGFNGSYILGIASYNAGPANVRRWVNNFGAPPRTLEGAVNWIESIPFGETRNYVMRVLENVQIYRNFESPNTAPQLAQDLTR